MPNIIPGIESFTEMLVWAAVAGLAIRFAPIGQPKIRIWVAIAVVLLIVGYMPFEVGTYRTGQLTTIGAWALVALGLNLLTGWSGQISLGHGAFVLIGAYTAAILGDNVEQIGMYVDGGQWPWWLAMLAAGCVSGFVGLLVGIPSLRLTGPYLAVATLALIIAAPSVFEHYDEYTGGRNGLRAPQPGVPGFLDFLGLERSEWFFFLAMFLVILGAAGLWAISNSKWGRAFVAVRESEVAAQAMGVSVARYKVFAFSMSAFYAGVAGALYVFAVSGYVGPQTIAVALSINFLTAIVIGGLGSIMGAIIGGFVVVLLPDVSTDIGSLFLGEQDGARLWPTVYGLILILVMILMPYGMAGFINRLGHTRPGRHLRSLRELPDRISTRMTELRERAAP